MQSRTDAHNRGDFGSANPTLLRQADVVVCGLRRRAWPLGLDAAAMRK